MANRQLPYALPRRAFLKQVAASAMVVGFNLTTGNWVTAVQDAEGTPFKTLPPLDGTFHLDDATLTQYSQDFGQIRFEQLLAVLKPGSVKDVSRMVRFARRHGIRIAGCGRGHTVFGQSQVPAGIVIDMGQPCATRIAQAAPPMG